MFTGASLLDWIIGGGFLTLMTLRAYRMTRKGSNDA